MSTIKQNEVVAALYGAMIEEFFEEGISVHALSDKYGRNASSIHKHLANYRRQYEAEYGVPRQRKKLPIDPRKRLDLKSLSFLHGTIGLRLYQYRTKHKLRVTEMGALINQSRMTVGRMEQGAHDFTINDIHKIAEVLNVPFDELVQTEKAA
ncbi:MAG: helix-turn-helix transcriptional regulator [Caulobacteraceae bacterium]